MSGTPQALGNSGDGDEDNHRNSRGTAESDEESDSSSEKTQIFDNPLDSDHEDGSVTSNTTDAAEMERCPEKKIEVGHSSSEFSKSSIRTVHFQDCSSNQDSGQNNARGDRHGPNDNPTDNHSYEMDDVTATDTNESKEGNIVDDQQSSQQNGFPHKDKITSIQIEGCENESIVDKPITNSALNNGKKERELETLVRDSAENDSNCDSNPKNYQKTGRTGIGGQRQQSQENIDKDTGCLCSQQTMGIEKNAADGADRQDTELQLQSHENINKHDVTKPIQSLDNTGSQENLGAHEVGNDRIEKELQHQEEKAEVCAKGPAEDHNDISNQAAKTDQKDATSGKGKEGRAQECDEGKEKNDESVPTEHCDALGNLNVIPTLQDTINGSDEEGKEQHFQVNEVEADATCSIKTHDHLHRQERSDTQRDLDPQSAEGAGDGESTSDEDDDDLMNFSLVINGNHVIQMPAGEEPLKWRFLFDCPYTFKELKEDSVFRNAQLSYKKGSLPSLQVKKPERKLKKDILELLKRHAGGLHIHQTVIPDEAASAFWTALHVNELFRDESVIAYKIGTTLYVCSRKEHMEEASRHVKITKDFALKAISKTKTIPIKDIPLQLMKRWMEVHMPADTSDIHYDFQEDQKSLHITGMESVIIKMKETIENLLGITIKRIYRTGKCVTHISFLEESVVIKYIEEILQEQKLVCSWETSKADCCIVVTAFDEETCEGASKVIDAACVTESIPLQVDETTRILLGESWEQEVSSICTKLGKKMKMWLDKEQNMLEYIHTLDIKDEVQHKVQALVEKWEREKYFNMDDQAIEHLENNKQKLKDLEMKYDVTIVISRKIERNAVIIKGMERNIQQTVKKLERECSAVLKPNPEAVKPSFSWENFDCFCVPESDEVDLILLRDSSTVFIHDDSDGVKMEDPETRTEVIEIIPEFTSKVAAGEMAVNMVLPSGGSKRPMTFCCPEWNDGRSKEKDILESVLGHLFKLIGDVSCEALFEVKERKIGKWPFKKFLKYILMAYQKHLKVSKETYRLFILVKNDGLYDIVKDVVFDQYVKNKVIKADTLPHKEDEMPTEEPRDLPLTTKSTSGKRFEVYVVKGVMTARKEDVLVNSTHHTLNLDKGQVSQSILKAAGTEIQHECYNKYPNGIKSGDLAVTRAHNLKNSKLIFHGTFEMWKQNNQKKLKMNLKKFVIQCLQKADEEKMKSIAFPSIGTGSLSYPHEIVADCMFSAVEEYTQTMPAFLEVVCFVIYHKDTKTIAAFDDRKKLYDKRIEGSSVDPESPSSSGGTKPQRKPAPQTPDQQNPSMKETAQSGSSEEGRLFVTGNDFTEAQCLAKAEVKVSAEVMGRISQEKSKQIQKQFRVTIDFNTGYIKGQLEDLQRLESHLQDLIRGHLDEKSLSDADEMEEEEEEEEASEEEYHNFPKMVAAENVSHVKYEAFRYFFHDWYVSALQKEVVLLFDPECGNLYVQGENHKVVDQAAGDIRTEIKKFQESDVSITREQFEVAHMFVVKMNSSSPVKTVFCHIEKEDPLTVHFVAKTYKEIENAKHKMNVELGTIRITNRQKRSSSVFDNKNENEQLASVSSKKSPQVASRKSFTTDEGIKVFVYKCSILQAQVEVIVNAANEDLMHTGGVAKVIADEAGKEFIEESQRYIRENGNLTVGATIITSGGKLKFPFVIHTVGPEWGKYSKTPEGMKNCMNDLWKAIIGCFFKAEELQVRSVALPAVSSGNYGIPVEICASQYLKAVLAYSKSTQGTRPLKEIHFIDVKEEILNLTSLVFSATLENSQAAAKKFDDRLQIVLSKFEEPSTRQTLKSIASFKKTGHSSEKQESILQFTKIFSVLIYTGDITDSKCKAIVSCEDKDLKSQGRVAVAIKKKAGQKFEKCIGNCRGRVHKVGDVIEIDAAGKLKGKKVICCIVPKWTSSMSDEDYKRQLGQCFRSILEKAKAYKSVAIPLIGRGFNDNSIELCGKVLLDSLWQFSKAHREKEVIREVHIVGLDDGAIACVKSIFMEHFDAEKKRLDAERRKYGYMEVGSATASGGHDQLSQNSYVQSRGMRQLGKRCEHNKTRVEVNMDKAENLASYNSGANQPPGAQKMNRSEDDEQVQCAICLDNCNNPVKMKKCGHVFCKDCIDTHFKHKPVCPVCSTIYGVITGNQPDGKMNEVVYKYRHLHGYDGCGLIEITYDIPNGIQGKEHPKPGQRYSGLKRKAYLPDNYKGQKVLRLLRLAFDRRLIFTIGQSITSGKDDMVTWNDIHHKTNMCGGPQNFAYPDPKYLDRVLDELAAKGVTEESENQDPGNLNAYYNLTSAKESAV